MRKLLSVGVVVAALLAPASSRAGVLTLGARTGISIGLGDVDGNSVFVPPYDELSMGEWVPANIPFQFDLLLRLAPGFAFGGYVSAGAGFTGDLCDDAGADCTAVLLRLGLQATYSFPGRVSPWLGAGFGHEWNMLDDGTDEYTFSGWEFLNLQGGVDFKLGGKFSLGPFAMLSIGEYDDFEGQDLDFGVGEKVTHEWLTFGVRGKFDL
jgi:hypothetical protein